MPLRTRAFGILVGPSIEATRSSRKKCPEHKSTSIARFFCWCVHNVASDSQQNLFLIAEIPGFTPQIGRLVSMMNYVRSTTLSAVASLGVDELDYVHDAQSNSIGSLLLHLAAAEVGYQAVTFHGRGLDEEEKRRWSAALELGDRARREIKGHELDYYVRTLEHVRGNTLVELRQRNDEWLDDSTSSSSGQRVNNYFKWFHVVGHEINHRGQIRWLRSRATKR